MLYKAHGYNRWSSFEFELLFFFNWNKHICCVKRAPYYWRTWHKSWLPSRTWSVQRHSDLRKASDKINRIPQELWFFKRNQGIYFADYDNSYLTARHFRWPCAIFADTGVFKIRITILKSIQYVGFLWDFSQITYNHQSNTINKIEKYVFF